MRAHPRILLQQGVGQIGRKISFRVVNLSSFPVVIDAVGFILKRGGRFLVIDPIVGSGQRFPGRLESRDAMTLLVDDTPERRHQLREAIRPFVTTACGVERLGPRTDADCLSGRESLPYE